MLHCSKGIDSWALPAARVAVLRCWPALLAAPAPHTYRLPTTFVTHIKPPMLTVNKLIPGARGLAGPLLKRATEVHLIWDVRQKSRFDATDTAGRSLGVFLPRGTVVRGGDVLVAEDGSLVRVVAAPQPVMQVRPCTTHGSPFDLARAAYHLGNRHVALQLAPEQLQLEPDHVLAAMLRQMHLIVTDAEAAFEPETGAYSAGGKAHDHGHAHGHDHGHDHDQHAHDHDHDHKTSPAPAPAAPRGKPLNIAVQAAAQPHVHGPGCGHGHDDHKH
jgi:urease accessory protein